MVAIPRDGVSRREADDALQRLLGGPLASSPQLARFLRFVVQETLEGRDEQLKEYSIAVGALGRPASFDPSSDATVRVAARQLRFKLAEYYRGDGARDAVVIGLSKGTYVPTVSRREAPVAAAASPAASPNAEAKRVPRRYRWAVAAPALILLAWLAREFVRPTVATSAQREPVIAVLPFANLTGKPDEEFISDGLADEVTTALARNPATRVISRTSAWKFKGERVDVRDVGRQLGAAYVIEGSVSRSDSRYRVAVQVNSAADGVRVWAEQYEVERASLFGLYDTIAQAVHEAVAARLGSTLGVLPARRAPRDPVANALYLEGRFYWNQRTDSSLRRAVSLFRQAIDHDSTLALGWAGLAGVYATMEVNHVTAPGVSLGPAKAAAARALALDPTLGEAWAAIGLLLGFSEWKWAASDSAFRRAVALSPGYATGRSWYSNTLLARGQVDDALVQLEMARQLDPLSSPIAYGIAQANYYGRRWAAGLRAVDRALELSPGNHWGILLRGKLLKGAGRIDEARALFAGLKDSMELALLDTVRREREVPRLIAAMSPGDRGRSQFWIATHYAQIGWYDSSFAWLERAREAHQPDLVSIRTDPMIDPVMKDPRYRILLAQIGLLEDRGSAPVESR